MRENEVFFGQNQAIVWHQVVRDKSGDPLADRDVVVVPSDLDCRVAEFAEYCVESSGDRSTSIWAAMNEINTQSQKLLAEVSLAETQEKVESTGPLLETAVGLYKSLENYYFSNFVLRATGD